MLSWDYAYSYRLVISGRETHYCGMPFAPLLGAQVMSCCFIMTKSFELRGELFCHQIGSWSETRVCILTCCLTSQLRADVFPLSMVPQSLSPCCWLGKQIFLLTLQLLLPMLPSATAEVTFPLMIMGRKSKDGQERMTTVWISSPHSQEMYVVTSFMSYSRPGIPLSSATQKDF